MTGRERILNVLEGKPIDRCPRMPITMMFAADVIGVKYREYATNYRVLAEAQLKTAEMFGFDYVSCISDPAREAADCGAAVEYFEDQPPALNEANALLSEKAALKALRMPDPLSGGRMHDRVRGAALLKEKTGDNLLVEGWVEGPCAEAADLRGLNHLMMDFFEDPVFVRDLFAFCSELGISFAKAQLDAGADIIGVGDAAASLVGPDIYRDFVWPCEKQLVDAIHDAGGMVRLHICGNTNAVLREMGELGCEIVDLDWMVPIDAARRAMGPEPVLTGNLDPVSALRNSTPAAIQAAVQDCCEKAGTRYIIAAGCEIPRDTPHENVQALVNM